MPVISEKGCHLPAVVISTCIMETSSLLSADQLQKMGIALDIILDAIWSLLSCALQSIVSCYMASQALDSLKGIMKWWTRWLRTRQRPSIFLAAYFHYCFWALPWVRQRAKHPREDLDTGNYLKNSEMIFFYLMQSLALPSVLYSTSLNFPAERWLLLWEGGTKSCVSSCCAAAQQLVTFLSCWWPAVLIPGDLCHLFTCTSLISRILLLQDLFSTESVHLLALLAAGPQFFQNQKVW